MLINKNSIMRLSGYRNALYRLKSLSFVKVFSDNLADAAGVASSVVRKDFSLFGITGNKKGGYLIDELVEKLDDILGKNETQKVIIVGAGHIGSAIMQYKGFVLEGIKIVAAFDMDEKKINRASPIPVLPLTELKDTVKKEKIKIAVLAVPDTAAAAAYELLVSAGIKGVLNFAPIRLRSTDDMIINNVNLVLELENVIYFMNAESKTKNGKGIK